MKLGIKLALYVLIFALIFSIGVFAYVKIEGQGVICYRCRKEPNLTNVFVIMNIENEKVSICTDCIQEIVRKERKK